MEKHDPIKILFVDFNQTSNYIAVGLSNGFSIFRVEPFSLCFHRDVGLKVTIIRMSYETNIMAFVGNKRKADSRDAKYSQGMLLDYKVLSLWNDDKKEIVAQFTFHSKIKNLCLTREQLYVIFKKKIYIYNIFTYQNIDIINTYPNPKGYFTVTENDKMLAYQDEITRLIRLRNYDKKTTIMFKANNDDLFALMTINSTGELLAVANKSGTNIYVFNTENGRLLQELKRGMKEAEILSINFDENNVLLVGSSHKGTVHIWSLQKSYDEINYNKAAIEEKKIAGEPVPMNHMTMWNKLSSKFQKEKSFAQLHLPKEKTICAFNPNEINMIITINKLGEGKIAKIFFEKAEIQVISKFSLLPDNIITNANNGISDSKIISNDK